MLLVGDPRDRDEICFAFWEKITEAGGGFGSITEHVDTTTPARRTMLQMLGAFAEFERSMVRERTRMSLKAARERGRIGGRKPKLSLNQRTEIIEMIKTTNAASSSTITKSSP